MTKSFRILLIVAFFAFNSSSCSQQSGLPFQEDIEQFGKADKKSFPPSGAILFVGSSSFTRWTTIHADLEGYTLINRGFGGSGLDDLIRYADRIIFPYKPRQVVIYCGENDIAAGKMPGEVLKTFIRLFNMIRSNLPGVNIIFISLKPSPAREKFLPQIAETNMLIRQFLSGYSDTKYVDVYHPMLNDGGKPDKDLFVEDDLHMNGKGYAIWVEALKPHLVR